MSPNPQNFLSLKDITARRGTDQAVGLVDEIVNAAPEVEKVMGRPIPGTYYDARVRTNITRGGIFRKANTGVTPGASEYSQRRFNCFFLDSGLFVDEAIARAAEQQGDSLALLQAEEAEGAIRGKAIDLSLQFYQGTTNDPLGFPGLINFLDAYSQVIDARTGAALVNYIDAGGATGNCEIVWYIWMHEQGVHFLWGGNQGIDIKPWMLLPMPDPNDPTKRLWGWQTNLSGYIGLSCANMYSVYGVINVDNSNNYAHPFTDKLDAELMALMPVGYKPNLCLMSKKSRAGLQMSRTVTLFGQMQVPTAENSGRAGNIAPLPEQTGSGVPIVVTDGILTGPQVQDAGA